MRRFFFLSSGARLAGAVLVLGAGLGPADPCSASGILHVVDRHTPTAVMKSLDTATRFYGADLVRVQMENPDALAQIEKVVVERAFDGIVISAFDGLVSGGGDVFDAMNATAAAGTPILILGIESRSSSATLERWSRGQVHGCQPVRGPVQLRFSAAAPLRPTVRHLLGTQVPYPVATGCVLLANLGRGAHAILAAQVRGQSAVLPVFLGATVGERPVYFASEFSLTARMEWGAEYVDAAIWEMTPVLMFVAVSGGESYWHSDGDYASFVIDDAWLREPYGHLSYRGLLQHMMKANFHTSIAFIPWYYAQSEPGVVDLLRSHPDRFSISVHGNNHSVEEFSPNETDHFYQYNIRQAILRMDRFSATTGIPYDKVMVFPRGIVPLRTFPFLKRNNFLATVNGSNVPIGAVPPRDILSYMRSGTLAFENLLSIRRYQPGSISPERVALELFLGNSLVFYAHQDFFRQGMDAFDRTATMVNRIEPAVRWTGLADITRHQYLLRKGPDGAVQVLMLSPSISYENQEEKEERVTIEKPDSFMVPIARFAVNGQNLRPLKTKTTWRASFTAQPRSSNRIEIEYVGVANLDEPRLESRDLGVYLTRRLSDFRDIYVARNAVGQHILSIYYRRNLRSSAALVLTIAICLTGSAWMIFTRWRKARRSRPRAGGVR